MADIIHIENRKVEWAVDNVQNSSRLFSQFDDHLLRKMSQEAYALHMHEYSIYYETYEKSDSFKNFFKVLATDVHEVTNKKFITAFEAYNYPIYGLMFHPEYQMFKFSEVEGFRVNNNEDTELIALKISKFFNSELSKSTHRFDDAHHISRTSIDNHEKDSYPLLPRLHISAHGFI